MHYFFDTIPTQNYFYMRRVGCYGVANYQLMDTLKHWLKQHHFFNEQTTIYGIAWDDPNLVSKGQCRYDVCSPVVNDPSPTTIAIDSIVPAGKYMVFIIDHTPQAISYFWRNFEQILQQENSVYNYKKPILERYRNQFISQKLCEMCVPVD